MMSLCPSYKQARKREKQGTRTSRWAMRLGHITHFTFKASDIIETVLLGPSSMLNAAQCFGLKIKLHKNTREQHSTIVLKSGIDTTQRKKNYKEPHAI